MKMLLLFRLGSDSKVENDKLENLSFISRLHPLILQMGKLDESSTVPLHDLLLAPHPAHQFPVGPHSSDETLPTQTDGPKTPALGSAFVPGKKCPQKQAIGSTEPSDIRDSHLDTIP